MVEYLDIVDENGKPTGVSKSRSEIHSGNYRHNTVHVYIFHKTQSGMEFLVHLRSKTKDHSPNKWDTRFGGHVKSGDTVEQAVLGELREEVGLDTSLGDFIIGFTAEHDWPNNHERNSIYYYQFDGDTSSLKFNDGEVQEVKWLSEKDILVSLKDDSAWTGGVEGFKAVLADLNDKL